jgi:hypothetical protein
VRGEAEEPEVARVGAGEAQVALGEADQVFERRAALLGPFLAVAVVELEGAVDQRRVDPFLVAEVRVDRADRDIGGGGELADRRRREAAAEEKLLGGVEDRRRGPRLAPLAAGAGGRRRRWSRLLHRRSLARL